MSDPTVCAVMLTRDRPEMAARAVRCFKRQTYAKKRLMILDNGEKPDEELRATGNVRDEIWYARNASDLTVGELRNQAISCCSGEIICHWDSDDISHPNRIADQVALLQRSGADCVGYREMLFANVTKCMYHAEGGTDSTMPCRCKPEAWMYTHSHPNYCLGTSLCYWRKAWEACKFPPTSRGEDLAFVQRVRALGVSGINGEPRMVATIHGSNTSESYDPRLMAAKEEWRRTPEWDDTVRKMVEEA